jgi:hypothetical protein
MANSEFEQLFAFTPEKPSHEEQYETLAFLFAKVDEDLKASGAGEAAAAAWRADGMAELIGEKVFSVRRRVNINDGKVIEELGIEIGRRVNNDARVIYVGQVAVCTLENDALEIDDAFKGKHADTVIRASEMLLDCSISKTLPLPNLNHDFSIGSLDIPSPVNLQR